MTAYYNEIDPFAAQWLRNLIAAGLIAPGDVDERSIEDVTPDEIRRYAQCHFFAGIGVWSYALRRAGWPDERPVWTGSCPCQPFSAAGKGGGFDDERHLWPAWFHLIGECRPERIFGEQVASKDGLGWFDLVSADLEGARYAVGAADLCAAGVGGPHIRQRLWFTAERLELAALDGREQRWPEPGERGLVGGCRDSRLADAASRQSGHGELQPGGQHGLQPEGGSAVRQGSEGSQSRPAGGVGHAERLGAGRDAGAGIGAQRGPVLRTERDDAGPSGTALGMADAADLGRLGRRPGEEGDEPGAVERSSRLRAASEGSPAARPADGFWRDADWLFCRDGKWRPVEPGTFPLAHGAASRVGRLRAYGNAICAEVAEEFIRAAVPLSHD